MNRSKMLARVRTRTTPWDIVIVGGGSVGMGIAVDAASRWLEAASCGLDVLLVEKGGLGQASSSRSTKLAHGGVRYLEQGNFKLVMHALKERELMKRNAPHLVHDLPFVLPAYRWWEIPFYGIGLKIYDALATFGGFSGKSGFGRSRILSKAEVLRQVPTIKTAGLLGGVLYHDGQFDDTRFLISLASTATDCGATLLNYVKVTSPLEDEHGQVEGVLAQDMESGEQFTIKAKIVINATGVFTDQFRRLANSQAKQLIAYSQGVHLVVDRAHMPGNTAIIVPKTEDGRVLFIIPWKEEFVLLGTTDTPIDTPTLEPMAQAQEIAFILNTASQYLSRPVTEADIKSIMVGIRPLAKGDGAQSTAGLSRDHCLHLDENGLLSVFGGKWTTYRLIAQDAVDLALKLAGLKARPCLTENLKIHGYCLGENSSAADEATAHLCVYGADARLIQSMIAENKILGERLHSSFPYCQAEVIWAVRMEMCRTVEDFLARHVRALFLNAEAAAAMAPEVAKLMAVELGQDEAWQNAQVLAFQALARKYSSAP
jgi:glycerol-3-phosphate dehydrogenase